MSSIAYYKLNFNNLAENKIVHFELVIYVSIQQQLDIVDFELFFELSNCKT